MFVLQDIYALYPFASRRGVARVLSTFLCAVAVAIRPLARLGGSQPFLVLTLKELVFSCQGTLAQQIELTSLNILGAMLAIGVSTFTRFLAVRIFTENSPAIRVIPAFTLVGISFYAGWVKSRLPRLQMSMRIACFVSIWLLTSDRSAMKEEVLPDAGFFVWITLSPAIICLITSMVVLRWSSIQFADETVSAVSYLHKSLSLSLDAAFGGQSAIGTTQNALQDTLLKKSLALNTTYSQAMYEVRIGRVGVQTIQPLIGIVESIRRELSWGLDQSQLFDLKTNDEDGTTHPLSRCCLDLGYAVLLSMSATQQAITATFKKTSSACLVLTAEGYTISMARDQLLSAQNAAREQLCRNLGTMDIVQPESGGSRFPTESFDLGLFMVSLLHISDAMLRALEISRQVIRLHEESTPRLWLPRISWEWLGSAPKTYISEERHTLSVGRMVHMEKIISTETHETHTMHTHMSANDNYHTSAQSRRDMDRRSYASSTALDTDSTMSAPLVGNATLSNTQNQSHLTWRRIHLIFPWAWRTRYALRMRLWLSRKLRSVKHSSHLRHAFKNALGVALLSLPSFLPIDSAGHQAFEYLHGQWATISYVWVMEVNTGATLRTAYLRLSGTLIGALYAYITWLICHTNPYGITIMVTLADIPASWVVINTPFAPLGVVADVTLPPIVFSEYFDPTQTDTLKTAALRGLMIGAGILAALLMNMFVFPRHCKSLFLNNTSRVLGQLCQLYMMLGRDMFEHQSLGPEKELKSVELEIQIRSNINGLAALITAMGDEMSLTLKPVREYTEIVQKLHKCLDLMAGMSQVREKVSPDHSYLHCLKQQRELMSCICISLFACEQVFRSRQPLPQFLPSSKQALRALEREVMERINQPPTPGVDIGLSLVYVYVEGEINHGIVDTMEDLLELSRTLFGTSAWLPAMEQQWVEVV